MSNKVYIAGKLFKEGDVKQRTYEGMRLKEEFPDFEIYNPVEEESINNKSNIPTANAVFDKDTDELMSSRYVVAELDDQDPGVMMELGIVLGVNYMRNLFNDDIEIFKIMLEAIPPKTILAHCSDIRAETANVYSEVYVPFGLNQYVVGGIEKAGSIHKNFDSIITAIKEIETMGENEYERRREEELCYT